MGNSSQKLIPWSPIFEKGSQLNLENESFTEEELKEKLKIRGIDVDTIEDSYDELLKVYQFVAHPDFWKIFSAYHPNNHRVDYISNIIHGSLINNLRKHE